MDLKKPLDFEEQIKRLKDHGMIIEDEEKANKAYEEAQKKFL